MKLPDEGTWLRVEALADELANLPREEAAAAMLRLREAGEPATILSFVANWLEAIKRRKRRMKTKARSKADPIERQIESAFRPGTFIRELHLQFHSSPVKIQSTAV